MSIAFRSASVTSVGQALTFDSGNNTWYATVNKPAGLTVGDMMVAISCADQSALSPQVPTWTLVGLFGGGYTCSIWAKIADAADVAAATLRFGNYPNISTPPDLVSIAWLAYSGGAQTVSIGTKTDLTGSGSLAATAMNARVAGVAVRAYFGLSGSTTSHGLSSTAPSGTSSRANLTTTAASKPEVLVVDEAIAAAGTTPSRSATSNGGTHTGVTLMIEGPHAPDQPTITAPGSGVVLDVAASNEFDWSFSDADPGDSQSAFDFRYSSNGGTSWTTVSATTSTQHTVIAGGTFTAGLSYQAQVRVYDQLSNVSAWSPSMFFTVANAPSSPVITSPTPDGATAVYEQTITWTATNQDGYEVRRVADVSGSPDTSTVYSDVFVTGAVDRSAAVTFDTNGRTEHVQVRVKYDGLFSAWADREVVVSWTPPNTPTLTLTASDSSAAIQVDITTATGGGHPDAVSVDLYVSTDDGTTSERIAAGLNPNSTFVYRTPASGVDYTFQAVATAADSTTAESDWTGSASGTPSDLRTTIIDGGGP